MKTKVLVVDDRPENIRALSLLIENEDIEIFQATNGDDALGLVLDHEFGLALLDVQMPGMSGFELAKLIRGIERSKKLPIIFVTASNPEAHLILEGYESGAVDVLFKPIDPHIVRNKVRVFVELDHANQLLHEQVREMARLKEAAEAASVSKSNFLRNISHELRTPLSAVLGYAELMNAGRVSPADSATYLASIRRNGQQLLHIIDDILEVSTLTAGSALTPSSIDSAPVATGPAPAPVTPPAEQTDILRGKNILVVDDVADNRILVERYLTPTGASVSMASGGGEAIQKVSNSPCDLVLMDIQMPGMDGCEATEHIRALGFRKPIVALTAHAFGAELERCVRSGCDLALTKPITKAALVKRLSEVLAR